jgi:hypothetical protein
MSNYRKEKNNMTRIIYDTTGKIFDIREGNYDIPVGIPYLEIDIPEGKYITSVDVTQTPNVAVFSVMPKPDYITRLDLLEGVINEILLM